MTEESAELELGVHAIEALVAANYMVGWNDCVKAAKAIADKRADMSYETLGFDKTVSDSTRLEMACQKEAGIIAAYISQLKDKPT